MTRLPPIVFLLTLVAALPAVCADELPYPEGRSTQTLEGLQVDLGIPAGISKEAPASLVVILHGAGGTATGMAGAMRAWVPDGYVVCAPKSSGQIWSDPDVERVKKIAQHLLKVLPIDAARVHVVGFSNGGWNLPPLAFDDDLKPRTATWVASGCRGASPSKWAASTMGVLALAGMQDANATSAAETVKLLRKKVKFVEARFQPQLGHEWPEKLMPYFRWWMGALEGRFVPGVDLNFEWGESVAAALAALADKKKGGVLIYAYDGEAKDDPLARGLQNEVFMDPLVRHYGAQIPCVKLEGRAHEEALAAYGVKTLPAVVVLKKDGKVKQVLEGKKGLRVRKVTSALRSVAPDRKRPEGL